MNGVSKMTVENWMILVMCIWCGVAAKDWFDIAVTGLILAVYFMK
jgi:putative effector of murein hydrolase LrgA (UPF0299 family)